ncbi:4'-phosphopantetheinyl transferase superfamily protein [Pontiella sp.]|uniref:4'-phosphopantetheinyl transferase family protein n=1 Tax=Pontiella sp. TaxID=2837462 RepID=UPI003567DFF3
METIGHIDDLPGLTDTAIHLWGVHVSGVQDRLEAWHSLLCEKERAKAARFHRASDRCSSIAARGALRILLSAYTGMRAAEIVFEYSENGKPHVAESAVRFNVSHSGDWVLLAFGLNRDIGVDIERIRPEMDVMSIASRYFTPGESGWIESAENRPAAFFHFWSRKEAYVKATGSGLFRELSSFAVPFDDVEKDGWFFQRLEAGPEYAAAVVTNRPVESLRCFDFGASPCWLGV